MKTLKLFNAVIKKATAPNSSLPYIDYDRGIIVEPSAMWAIGIIKPYIENQYLTGHDMNKTFHRSWAKIQNSSRIELLMHQLLHYITTYGSDFTEEMYIPNEVVELPESDKLKFKVIKAYTADEMTKKCLDILKSGIALDEETLNDILSVLFVELKYGFTGNEVIRNKEAIIKIADVYGHYPSNPVEFLRYIVYRSTNSTLLIKDEVTIETIKASNFNPEIAFNKFGLEKLASIFNRFKRIFLAYKRHCPGTINKISKLSKIYHKPMVQNPLNLLTTRLLSDKDTHWLDNATPYALFKCLNALYTRMDGQETFAYRIRNGKSYVKNSGRCKSISFAAMNFDFIIDYLKSKYDLTGKTFVIQDGVYYALPTSEKMFVGNIPTGTRFVGEKLVVGVHWENSYGARDIDLSGLNIGGKVGWNSSYNYRNKLLYSGDITNAPNGAVEYLHAKNGLDSPTLVQTNIFNGDDDCRYDIILSQGDEINRDFMMNPNNLFLNIPTNSVQKQTILGIFTPQGQDQVFTLLNFGAGNLRISGSSNISAMYTKALFEQWHYPFTFNTLVMQLGGTIVTTMADVKEVNDSIYDLSLENLEKDSFIKIFQ
jgi:hypothetical protein